MAQKNKKTVVLFVCEHGAARSTIASAYFNKLIIKEGLKYKSVFRGASPDSIISPATQKGLTQDSFDIKDFKPQLVTKADVDNAFKIITFDCTLPDSLNSLHKPVLQWNGIPAISKDYTMARNLILQKVNELITTLPKNKKQKANDR